MSCKSHQKNRPTLKPEPEVSCTNSDWLLISHSIHTRTQNSEAESWCMPFWGAVLHGDLPSWVTLTTVGDSRRTLLLSQLEQLREQLLHDLTHGTPLLLTRDLLGDLALLGDVPTNLPTLPWASPSELSLVISMGLPWEASLASLPIASDQSSSRLVASLMARPSFHGAFSILAAGTDPPDSRLTTLLPPWKVTSRSSTNLEYRGSSSDDNLNTIQQNFFILATSASY